MNQKYTSQVTEPNSMNIAPQGQHNPSEPNNMNDDEFLKWLAEEDEEDAKAMAELENGKLS